MTSPTTFRSICLLAVLALASACAGADDGARASASTTSSVPVDEPADEPPTSTTTAVTTTEPAAPAFVPVDPACPAVPTPAAPAAGRPTYDVALVADPTTGVVDGTQTVRFRPDVPVDRVVFRLWSNSPRLRAVGTLLEVTSVTDAAGVPIATEQPDVTRLDVLLPGRPGDLLELVITWHLEVGGPVNDRVARDSGSLRLGSFLPLLAWQPGIGWATEPPTSGFAEAATSPTADWRVTLTMPDGFGALASGKHDGEGWTGIAMRDFALSIGRFTTQVAIAHAPDPVEVAVGVHDSIDRPDRYVDTVVRALEQFAARFGPYPWSTYTLAITPDLSGGIEFPTHVMQGPGTHGRTTPHEVAHMWFYGLVGNNQGLRPWIDEGLATYAEGTFLGSIGGMGAQAIPSSGRGRAGEPMTYWESLSSAYYRSVYVQTAAALSRLGPHELVDCALAHLVAMRGHGLATPVDVHESLALVFPEWADALTPAGLG